MRQKVWDVFYIVQNQIGEIKFGITSGDARPRLGRHARNGYTQIVRLYTDLPGEIAYQTERLAIKEIAHAGIKPIRGREYYPAAALSIILGITEPHGRE